MFAQLTESINQRISSWVSRRIPPSKEKVLSHKEIFVLPTRWGLLFGAMVVLIIVTGINYQNSMILAMGMFLIAVMILSIVFTYKNLSGLELSYRQSQACFAGENASFEFVLTGKNRSNHIGIELGWVPDKFSIVDVLDGKAVNCQIDYQTKARGLLAPGRMLITTTWPLGLVRAWSWQDLQAQAVVYPRPMESEEHWGSAEGENENSGQTMNLEGQEDFSGLKTFVPGESLNRVAWKKYAQTGELYSKEFTNPGIDPEWIDFTAFQIADVEMRLSMMCGQLLSTLDKGRPIGMKLPGLALPPGTNFVHRQNCLTALALFPDHNSRMQSQGIGG